MILFRKHAMQYLKLQRLPRAVRTEILLQLNPAGFPTPVGKELAPALN
jgi:hypothetical protein